MILSSRILFTGFLKVHPKGVNSSFILLDNISNQFSKFLFSNDYAKILSEIEKLFSEKHYDYVILFGQKPLIRSLFIELCCKINDDVLETNFPLEKLMEDLKENHIKYKLSRRTGNSYCNFLYYHTLKYLKERQIDTKVIFIHLPYQDKFREFSSLVEIINKYLERKDIYE